MKGRRPPTRFELEELRAIVETKERLQADPLAFVPMNASEHRKELIAYIAAGLAVGNVVSIRRSVERVITHLDAPETLAWPAHRWIRGPDLAAVIRRLRELQSRHGSLGAAFGTTYEQGDLAGSLTRFSDAIRNGLPSTRGVRSLTSRPADGSACKRLNLFMRWMVRTDGFDLGLWTEVSPKDLRIPLDAHVLKFVRRYRLSDRVTVDWKLSEEVTRWFARRCPDDPLRWDFTISHYGMTHGWELR
jgi:uncharacterized protein (TIGR02757 family)